MELHLSRNRRLLYTMVDGEKVYKRCHQDADRICSPECMHCTEEYSGGLMGGSDHTVMLHCAPSCPGGLVISIVQDMED